MLIKFKEMQGILIGLDALLSLKCKTKLNHWAGRWQDNLIKEVESIEKSRVKLLENLCNKDKDGKPIMIPLKDDKDKPIIKDGKPQTKYDLTLENEEKFNQDYKDLLEESMEIDLKPLPFDEEVLIEGAYQKLLNPIIDPEFIKQMEE
jgi:hypothetical protein